MNKHDCTLLNLAIRKCDVPVDIISLLVTKDNINVGCGNYPYPPLHTAIILKHWDVVRLLLQRNASVDTLSENGDSPLAVAVRISDVPCDILNILMSSSTINKQNKSGDTPLHHALDTRKITHIAETLFWEWCRQQCKE
jgi:ankyrin repeat protein